jgi:lipopolysaccharide transport system ATP-binding protein
MSDYAIRLDGIWKQYRVGQADLHRTLRDAIARAAGAPVRGAARVLDRARSGESAPPRTETMWALQDVDLEIRPGEVVGIIGRNGAGKSTLLKILTRITEPTKGRGVVRGRVGSLLEVGTGFHPELTGRENVFLNGAILGMGRRETRRKLDEIVDFAGIGAFLDTPVKRYSSGMYMRLAFSVAAHIEPEILLVDEVLAVGDAEFQARCLGKMEAVGREGRTVVFVSHNIGAISELCSRGLVMNKGKKVADLPISDAIATYTRDIAHITEGEASVHPAIDAASACSILRVGVSRDDGAPGTSFSLDEGIVLTVDYEVREPLPELQVNIMLSRNMVHVLNSHDTDDEPELPTRLPGRYRAVHRIPPHLLKAGLYSVTVGAGDQRQCFQSEQDVIGFEVTEYSENTGKRGYRSDRPGVVISPGTWSVTRLD